MSSGSRVSRLTTRTERLLILISIVLLPLQDHFPTVAGASVSFLIFVALGAYVFLNRLRALGRIWQHPVFIAAYVFIGVCALLEFSSPLSRYDQISRFALMIGGAICVAVLTRDRSALAAGLYGYMGAALWVGGVLYLTSYGTLHGASADDFGEASALREETIANSPIQANLNGMGFVCAQGAIAAFGLSLSNRVKQRRILLLGVVAFCFVAAFLTMSRGTALICLVSFSAILYTHGFRHGKALVIAVILGVGIYMAVPDAVWSRMSYSTEQSQDGKMEARAWLYTTLLNRLPEYIVAGVGSGNYYSKWGFEKGLAKKRTVAGAHNSLLQITIFWGALGLLLFLWIMWLTYRTTPLHCSRDELSLALLGIVVSLGVWILQQHGFYDKTFSIGLGLLIGARQWIWPSGIVSASQEKY